MALLGSSENCVRRIYSGVKAAPSVSCVSVSLAGDLSHKLRYAGLYSEQTTQQTDKDLCVSVYCDLAYKDGCVPGNRLLCTLQRDKDGCVPGIRLLCTYTQRRVCTWQQITLYRQTETGVYLAGIHSPFPLAGTHHVVGQPVVVAVQRAAHVVVHDGHHALLQHAGQHARV